MKTPFFSSRLGLSSVLATALFCCGLALPVQAAEAPVSLMQPQTVILTPQNARLQGEVPLTAQERGDQSVLLLTLPQEAQDITLDLLPPHARALRDWRTEPVVLTATSGSAGEARATLLTKMDSTQGRIGILHAQQMVLRNLASNHQNASPADTQLLLQDVERQLAPLAAELFKQERQLKTLQNQLNQLPATSTHAVQVVISLHGVTAGTDVGVRYAYTLPQCGWTPVYAFDAHSAQNTIDVRMLAEVWQNSGMNWDKADIILTTATTAQREPRPVSPWIVRKGHPEARPMLAAAPQQRQAAPQALSLDNAAPTPQAFESDAQSGWTLPKGHDLPEGRTRLPILEYIWEAPLERVARPSEAHNQVWLAATYKMQGQSLPTGDAVYLLDGSAVGTGHFATRNGEATLFFGADPLVTVQIQPDTRLTGKAGIIDKRQTWHWGWTYTVRNERAQPVTVRLEEAAPQAGDKDITVTLNDTPKAVKDTANRLLWDVQVPAKGSTQVRHEVSITAPQNMDVWPGR